MRRRGMLVVMAGATAGVACSLVFPFDGYGPGSPLVDAGPADAAAIDAADAFSPGCPLARPPAPPATDDPGGTDTNITLAISALLLGAGTATTPGLDVDGLCTCPDPPPCVSPQRVCDRDGGVDNAFDDLVGRFGAFGAPIDQQKVQASLDKGATSVVAVIYRYNGLPNDTSVELGLIASLGMNTDDAGDPIRPRHDGTDEWTVDPASITNKSEPFIPKTIATAAYVSGGVLVARGPLIISLGSATAVPIALEDGVFTGRLVHDGIWRITDGRITGRWSTGKLLTSFAVIADPLDKTAFLCGDSGAYLAYKPQLCAAADISANAADDLTGKKCDAMSFGMGFDAVEAKLGALAPPRTQKSGCGPDWQDDCPK